MIVTGTYVHVEAGVRVAEVLFLDFTEFPLKTFLVGTAPQFSSRVGPVTREVVLHGIALRFRRLCTYNYHGVQQIVDGLLVSVQFTRSDRQTEATVDKKQEIVESRKFGFRLVAEEWCRPDKNLQVPCNGNVPATINPTALSDEMCDAVGEQLHHIPSTQLHVLVWGT